MDALEVNASAGINVSEAPLQMKSNCGTLVIDDFGRQRMTTDELLNRWIVPLEKRYDFLQMNNGKKIQVPFDQLIIFSTNLEPKDLVDDAFLRRIPYKIEVLDPSEEEFRELFKIMAPKLGIKFDAGGARLPDRQALPQRQPPVPLLPAARPAAADRELLPVPRAAAGDVERVLRLRGGELLRDHVGRPPGCTFALSSDAKLGRLGFGVSRKGAKGKETQSNAHFFAFRLCDFAPLRETSLATTKRCGATRLHLHKSSARMLAGPNN